jgi:hypothetical protein
MHLTASPVWDAWSELSTRLPADLDLDALARSTHAIQRRRGEGVHDGATLLQLSLARGPGGKSLQETAVWAHLNGLAELTGQSLNERLHRSVAFLAAITDRLLAGRTAGRGLLWSGRCLRVADGSSLSQPGSAGTDWRLHGVYDLSRGGFSHVELTDRTGAESLLRCAPVAGEVLIADRGYAKAKELRACLAPSGSGTRDFARDFARDFIVRVGWKALALRDRAGNPFNLIAHLEQLPEGDGPREWAVQAVTGSLPTDAQAGATSLLPIQPRETEAHSQQAPGCPRPAQSGGRRLHGAGDVAAGRDPRGRDLCRLSIEVADRTGVQAAEIAAPHRPITDPHKARQPELAVCPSDPASADRRHLPGFPGSFPLRTLPMPLGARDGGSPSWRSTHCTAPYAASPYPPSATLARARTNFSPIQNESENDKCLLPAGAYPDAYGACPGHPSHHWCRLGWSGQARPCR